MSTDVRSINELKNRCYFIPQLMKLNTIAYPPGMLMPFAGNVELEGWTDCDGKALSRTEYANLFATIGTIYGEGDGETTFNVPDFRDKTIWGGTTAGAIKEAGLPNVTQTNGNIRVQRYNGTNQAKDPLYSTTDIQNKAWYWNSNEVNTNYRPNASLFMDLSRANPIYGKSDTVQPPAITVRILIKL